VVGGRVTLFLAGAIWILALTRTIVMPVITAAVVAAVAAPLAGWLARRGLGRGGAAAVLLVGIIVVSTAVVLVVVGGITGQLDERRDHLATAKDEVAGWATDLGVERGTAEGRRTTRPLH
jgi:putative heme transporter